MDCQYLERAGKNKLAYCYTPPTKESEELPTVVFLGGFKSDMNGTKANYLEQFCKKRGQGYLRLDYSGHGLSEGSFRDGTIGQWKEDALAVFDHIDPDTCVLVGSSMGGWISLLLAKERRQQVKAFIGIAAAPDFTLDLWFNRFDENQRKIIEEQGFIELPNNYSDEPYIFTKALFDDGEQHFLMNEEQDLAIPMTLLQGMLDPDVAWETAIRIQNAFSKAEVDIVFIDDGDHSLSRPEDLELLGHEVEMMSNLKPNLNSL